MARKKINQGLVLALEKLLKIAQGKLARAKEKDNRWDIANYRKDIRIIKAQLDNELSRR